MLSTSDTINYQNIGFDGQKYIALQGEKIRERISLFSGRLYLEIGGKFLHDPHASRVLPGFFPDSKKQIFSSLIDSADIIFCVNIRDLVANRALSSDDISYEAYVMDMLEDIKNQLGVIPHISINRVSDDYLDAAKKYRGRLQQKGYQGYLRYDIEGYPENTGVVLSDRGYGFDEYIPVSKNLVLVTGAASSSGKMSTCLGQIYHEAQKNIESGYAKYETFPIWNIDLNHPINLAYEAATADISDYNMLDPYHMKEYGQESVNYNRDVEAFEIVMNLAHSFLPESNPTRKYKSPTDMGISNVGFCIIDEDIVNKACEEEIIRRRDWYRDMGDEKSVVICEGLLGK